MRQKLATLLALATTACTGWRAETAPTPVATENAATKAQSVRLTLKDGRVIDLASPQILGDSVVGYNRDGRPDFARSAVAVKDVKSVKTYGFDAGATAGLVLVSLGATVALIGICVASFSGV